MDNREQIIATIARELREQGVPGEIHENSEFAEMPIDSLSLYTMMAGVEDAYDVEFDACRFSRADTVGQLADLVIDAVEKKFHKAA